MVKSSKDKKLILGSALAGLILAGPGLSVTATPMGKFFQTAELKAGYRLAQAADAPKPEASPKPKDGDKHCSGEMKCGAGACGGDKKSGDKHCSGDKKSEAPAAGTSAAAPTGTTKASDAPTTKGDPKKASGEMKCGAGACGGGK